MECMTNLRTAGGIYVLHDGHRFLWVACQLDELQNCATVRRLKQSLNSLPINLVDTYRRTLSKINDYDIDDVRTTLSWLCFGARPLSLEEIGGVLEVDLNSLSMDSDRRYLDLTDILSSCTSLVHQESPDDVGKNFAQARSLLCQGVFAVRQIRSF